MNKQPLVIEFIGLPGAGKTTIAHVILDELTAAGFRCFGLSTSSNPEGLEKRKGGVFGKLKTLYQFALACALYRQFAANAFLFAFQVKPFSPGILQRLFIALVRLKFIRTVMNGGYDFIILDQGLIQNIWSIAITGNPEENKYLERVLRSIIDELDLVVVMVDVEAKLAVERMNGRSTMRSRFDRMPPCTAEAMLSKHKEIFVQIVDSTPRLRKNGFLHINGSQPIEENVRLIVPFIEEGRQAINA